MSATKTLRQSHPAFWKTLCAIVAAALALSLICWAVRVVSTVRQGDVMLTTGFEDASVYNVWKARQGAPVYEWPDRGNYSPTFYNFGFYRAYALLLDTLGLPNDARGLLGGRLLTSAFALFGAAGQFMLSLRLLRPGSVSAPERGFLGMLAALTWFSTNTTGWGAITLRPDLAGLSFAVWGVVAWLTARENFRADPSRLPATVIPLLAAAGCFFAAWSFKQSLVWALSGVMLHALLSEPGWRWRALGWVALPVGAAMVACVRGFGPEYRENTLVVMAAFGFSWRIGVPLLVQTAITWFPLWWFALGPILSLARTWRSEGRVTALARTDAPVVCAVLVAAAFNVFAAFKYGSGSNILWESFFLACALAGASLVRLARTAATSGDLWPRLQRGVALVGWAVFLLLPIVQLVLYAQGRGFTQLAGLNPGGLRKLTAPDEALRRDFAAWLPELPKPLFTRDGLFVQPWHATNGRYPSFVIDFQAYDFMRRRGLMRADAGVADFIRARHFGSLLLDVTDTELLPVALAAGYRVQRPMPARFSTLPNEYGQPARDLQCLERPPEQP